MTTTVLTDEQIAQALNLSGATDYADVPLSYDLEIARAIEQAVLQSPEVQALRKDAERYRFMRHPDTGPAKLDSLHNWVNDDCNPPYRELKYGDDLDAAIDTAMQEQKT